MNIRQKLWGILLPLTGGAALAAWLVFTLLTRNRFALGSFSAGTVGLCLGMSLAGGLTSLLWKKETPFWSWSRVTGWILLALAAAGWLFTLTAWSSGWNVMLHDGRLSREVYGRLLWCAWGGLGTSLAGLLPGIVSAIKFSAGG